jgi:hypothetical protein
VNGVLDVLHELGSGGSGTTYLCRDLKTAKVCAWWWWCVCGWVGGWAPMWVHMGGGGRLSQQLHWSESAGRVVGAVTFQHSRHDECRSAGIDV